MSTQHDIGDEVVIYGEFTTTEGSPANPTTVALSVRAPDGTITTVDPVNDELGKYHGSVLPDAPGIWRYRWEGTGALVVAEEGWFYVRIQRVGAS